MFNDINDALGQNFSQIMQTLTCLEVKTSKTEYLKYGQSYRLYYIRFFYCCKLNKSPIAILLQRFDGIFEVAHSSSAILSSLNRSLLICKIRFRSLLSNKVASSDCKRCAELMKSNKYTRIEITPEAYKSLEAESILQGKTLKKLASELILKGVSKKALDFVQSLPEPSFPRSLSDKDAAKLVKMIGASGIHISNQTLHAVKEVILAEGYQAAMLHVAQHTASMERDELHRVLEIMRREKLPTKVAADLVEYLNEIESASLK